MALNQLKKYNDLLDIDALIESDRNKSLEKIFERDFINHTNKFNNKNITPTPIDGEATMGTLFNHLTRTKDGNTHARDYDSHRSKRIHWIRFHFENEDTNNIQVFSVDENGRIRTYIFDKGESYVIILEPKQNYYFLITAYYLRGGDSRKIQNKMKKKLPSIY